MVTLTATEARKTFFDLIAAPTKTHDVVRTT